jgi:threonine synthase
MGLPVKKLILATNENNILSRFFNTGEYSLGDVVPTISPSMDIQVASNFERYLYYRTGCDAEKLAAMMDEFSKNGALTVDGSDDLFAAGEGNTEQTLVTIRKYHDDYDYTLDPHTAVGVAVAERFQTLENEVPTICLATAHPAKFTDAIEQAVGEAAHHPVLDKLADAETRCDTIANDEQAIRDYLIAKTAK